MLTLFFTLLSFHPFMRLIVAQVLLESKQSKHARVNSAIASSKRMRRVSGWNVFQREQLKDAGSLDPVAYKNVLSQISSRWKQLSDDVRDSFEVQAQFEQVQRERVSEAPLGLKGSSKSEVENLVGRSALKKLSVGRLQHNLERFANHSLWSAPNQLGESALSKLGDVF